MRKKLVLVCNSSNPAMVQFFISKVYMFYLTRQSDLLICFTNKANIPLLPDKIDVRISSVSRNSFFDIRIVIDIFLAMKLFAVLISSRVSYIHFDSAHVSNLFLSLPAKALGIKLIFSIHDPIPHPGMKKLFIGLYNRIVIHFLADEIISFSKKFINKMPNPKKCRYMPLMGFQQKVDSPKVGDRTILFFGRMEPYKGFNNLLNIAKLMKIHLPDYRLLIAGKGKITNYNDFKKMDNVRMINRFISEEELSELFHKASFTILPYDSATHSGVILLSYAYATPVIAYDIGAFSEYVDDKCGFLIKYHDDISIIEILSKVTESDIKALSSNVIDKFAKSYSWDAAINFYEIEYKSIVKQ